MKKVRNASSAFFIYALSSLNPIKNQLGILMPNFFHPIVKRETFFHTFAP